MPMSMDDYEITVEGLRILDPRDGQRKVSDNPALVFADLAQRGFFLHSIKMDDKFWDFIGKMADYCEEKVDEKGL